MAHFNPNETFRAAEKKLKLVYLLYAIGLAFPASTLAGFLLLLTGRTLKIDEPLIVSHRRWLIVTGTVILVATISSFLAIDLSGGFLSFIIAPEFFAADAYTLYRIVRGIIFLNKRRPVDPLEALTITRILHNLGFIRS
uniref:Uncharacterized protein n=1 Tax=Leptospirillum ferriphilum TaxID=178606 RepID=A0A7C3QUN2_9BACT